MAAAVEITGCNCPSAHKGANCLLFKSTTFNIRKHAAGISDIVCHRYFLICNLLLKNEADIYFLQETTDEFYLVMLHQSSLPSLYHIYYSTTIKQI
jgi:hypothetical protein